MPGRRRLGRAVEFHLSFAVDKAANAGHRFVRGAQVEILFFVHWSRALPMIWDYAVADPFSIHQETLSLE